MTEPAPLPPISAPETSPDTSLGYKLRHFSLRNLIHSPKFLASLLVILVGAAAALILLPRPSTTVTPPPVLSTPAPSPELPQLPPSPFATDSGLLQLKSQLNDLDNQLTLTDMDEKSLLPPTLDLSVKFE